jgi:divalent metal cation (Fe/Co/Zn/Cd) transporter
MSPSPYPVLRELWRGVAPPHDRTSLLASALRLSYFTIAWNGAAGVAALILGVATGSLALDGFALNALLDSSASMVLVWRFTHEQRSPAAAARVERRAQALIGVSMLMIGAYVGVQAVRALVNGSHPGTSAFAVGLAAVSLLVLPLLGKRKLEVASHLGSPALRGDAVLTLAAGALAAITLCALIANAALGWWWVDALAALVIAAALAFEGTRVLIRHRFG